MTKPLIIYDGDCGFCEKSKNILQKLDWLKCFHYEPLQNEKAYAHFPELTPEDCFQEIKLIEKSKKIYGGADAIIRICLRLPLCFPFGILFWLPPFRQIARWLYPKVANNRYRLSKACRLEKPSEMSGGNDGTDHHVSLRSPRDDK